MMSNLQASYDNLADVLYLSLGEPVKAITHPDEDNLLWRESIADHVTVGVTILDYAEDWASRRQGLAHLISGRLRLPEDAVMESLPLIPHHV